MNTVSIECLQTLIREVPNASTNQRPRLTGTTFDLPKWIADQNLQVTGPSDWKGGLRWVFHTCPWDPAHQNNSAYIVQRPDGAIAAGCHHNGCAKNDWHTLRDLVEPGWRSNTQFEPSEATIQVLSGKHPYLSTKFGFQIFQPTACPIGSGNFVNA